MTLTSSFQVLNMFAETFNDLNEIEDNAASYDSDHFNVLVLFDKFIAEKYVTYESRIVVAVTVASKEGHRFLYENFVDELKVVAVSYILPTNHQKRLTRNQIKRANKIFNMRSDRSGILVFRGAELNFLHRTFAEYFVAQFLFDLFEDSMPDEKLILICQHVFLLVFVEFIKTKNHFHKDLFSRFRKTAKESN